MSEKYTVYTSKANPALSTAGAVRELGSEIKQHYWHIKQLFKRDFVDAYQLTRFGVIWNYILPMVPITVWVLLNTLRFFPGFNGVSSVVYVTMGVTLWFLFAGLISFPVSAVESKIKDVARSKIPLIGIVIASYARLSFDTLVRIAGTAAIFTFFHGPPHWMIIFTPVILFFAFLFFSGAGLILAIFNLAYRDINKIIVLVLQYGILLSSVIFPLDSIEILAKASLFNPFYVFIDSFRTLTVFGKIEHPYALGAFCLLALLVFLFGCRLFHASEQRLKGWA